MTDSPLSPNVQNSCRVDPASYLIGHVPWGLSTHPHFMSLLRMSGAKPSQSLHAFIACVRIALRYSRDIYTYMYVYKVDYVRSEYFVETPSARQDGPVYVYRTLRPVSIYRT